MKIVGNKKHIKWENYDRYKVKYLEEDVPTYIFVFEFNYKLF